MYLFRVFSFILLGLFLISQCQANYYEYEPYYEQNASRWDNYIDYAGYNNYNYPSDNETYQTIIPVNPEHEVPMTVTETEAFKHYISHYPNQDPDTESEIPPLALYANSYSRPVPRTPSTDEPYRPDYNTNNFYRNYPTRNEKAEAYEPEKYGYGYKYHPTPAPPPPPEIQTSEEPVPNTYTYEIGPQYTRIPEPEVVYIPVKEKSFRKPHYSRSPPRIKPPPFQFPSSPLPGWSGIYSPNPGYLVKQKFQIYRPPIYIPPRQKSLSTIWHKAIG